MKTSREKGHRTGRATDVGEVGRQEKNGFKKEMINREESVIKKPVR